MGVEILGDVRKQGSLLRPRVSGCLTAVQGLWNCPVPLGPGEVLAEQMTRLSLGRKCFSLGPSD